MAALASAGVALCGLGCGVAPPPANTPQRAEVAYSAAPPRGLAPTEVPQFVALTSDDNFGDEPENAPVGGMRAYLELLGTLQNPSRTNGAWPLDAQPARGTFFNTAAYLEGNLSTWKSALSGGHEMANHTFSHFNGAGWAPGMDSSALGTPNSPANCCGPRGWDAAAWKKELTAAHAQLAAPGPLGTPVEELQGFRAPFLAYNDALFDALTQLAYRYDSSIPNCLGPGEDGTRCSWPYTLAQGSPDAAVMTRDYQWAPVGPHAGLWELGPTTFFVPTDEHAARYGFEPGLRARIAAKVATAKAPNASGGVDQRLPYPTVYNAQTGAFSGLDYSLLMDASVTPAEFGAILKYTLDQHLAGNRAPFVICTHSFLYAFDDAHTPAGTPVDSLKNSNTPTLKIRDARWAALVDFLRYAHGKPEVRFARMRDVLDFMER